MWAQGQKQLGNPLRRKTLEALDANTTMSCTHTSEWLMSSRVAEAVRYLKGEQKWADYHLSPRDHCCQKSLERATWLCNPVTWRQCGMTVMPAERVGVLSILKTFLLFHSLVSTCHLRAGGLDVLPAFGQALFEVTEWAQTQLPPDVCCRFFFDQKHLAQSLDLLLHLNRRENTKVSTYG